MTLFSVELKPILDVEFAEMNHKCFLSQEAWKQAGEALRGTHIINYSTAGGAAFDQEQ